MVCSPQTCSVLADSILENQPQPEHYFGPSSPDRLLKVDATCPDEESSPFGTFASM